MPRFGSQTAAYLHRQGLLKRAVLPPAVRLDSEHSSLSFSLPQKGDTQIFFFFLYELVTLLVRDMTALWPAMSSIRRTVSPQGVANR